MHHAAHLHGLKKNPYTGAVERQGKRPPWRGNEERGASRFKVLLRETPRNVERNEQTGIEQDNLHCGEPAGYCGQRRKTCGQKSLRKDGPRRVPASAEVI